MVQTHIDAPSQQIYFEKINELVNFFALTKGFGIVFCVANNFFFRKEVNRQIIERLADKDIIITDFLLDEENNIAVVEQLKKLQSENKEAKGLIINNLDFLLDRQSNALAAFNQSRDVLSKLEMPLLFWLNEENIRSLSKSAPDIYTFRSLPILEFKEIPDFQSESFLIPRFSEDYRTTEDYEKIRLKIELLERQLEEAKKQEYPKGKIIDQIVIPLFLSYKDLQLYQKMEELYTQFCSQLNQDNTKHLSLQFYLYENRREFEKALLVGEKIQLIEKGKKSKKGLAITYYNIAKIYWKQEKNKEALNFILKSKKISENSAILIDELIPKIYNGLGIILTSMKNYEDAERYLFQNLEKAKKTFPVNYGNLYTNLASVYFSTGNIKQAEKYQLKAINCTEKEVDDYNIDLANCYYNYALTLNAKQEFQKTFIYLKKAYEILKFGKHENLPIFKQVDNYIEHWKKIEHLLLKDNKMEKQPSIFPIK